jgi:hypothetical protein
MGAKPTMSGRHYSITSGSRREATMTTRCSHYLIHMLTNTLMTRTAIKKADIDDDWDLILMDSVRNTPISQKKPRIIVSLFLTYTCTRIYLTSLRLLSSSLPPV